MYTVHVNLVNVQIISSNLSYIPDGRRPDIVPDCDQIVDVPHVLHLLRDERHRPRGVLGLVGDLSVHQLHLGGRVKFTGDRGVPEEVTSLNIRRPPDPSRARRRRHGPHSATRT